MSETTPHESKPNFEPPFDIIRTVLDEQALDETCDEMEQLSRALSNLDILNKRLAGHAIRAALTITECGIRYEGYEQLVKAVVQEGGTLITTGYVGAINYGKLMGTPGYVIHLVTPGSMSKHPFFPDNPPVSSQFVVAAAHILDYQYLPIETTDQEEE